MTTCPRPSGVSDTSSPLARSDSNSGLQRGQVGNGLHPRRPAAQLAHGLVAAQQQLGHHRQLDLIHAQPIVEIMAILLHPAVALDQPHGADGPQPVEASSTWSGFELHQRPAVVLLVAAGADGGEAHGIDVGRGLGLFRQDAQQRAVRPCRSAATAAGSAQSARRRKVRWSCKGLLNSHIMRRRARTRLAEPPD